MKNKIVKCKICNNEYKYQMFKYHVENEHKILLENYLYQHYNIPINFSYKPKSTIIEVNNILQNMYGNCNIKQKLQELYNEHGTYKKLNKFLGFKCNEFLLYLNIQPKKQFSQETKNNMSKAHKNRDNNKIINQQILAEQEKNNERIKCKICNKNYHINGLGYHLNKTHNITVKDYLYKYYSVPYSNIKWREITCKDIYIIEKLKQQFNINDLKTLFQYIYDNYGQNYRLINEKFNHDLGKICICLGVQSNNLMSINAKKRISISHLGKSLSEYHKYKIKIGMLNMDIEKKKLISKKISKANLGRKHTRESILKIIKSKENQNNIYRGNGGYRNDIGHYVRSTWEANYARILQYLNIDYEYEKEIYWLERKDGSEVAYIPDYFIGDLIIEIKGRWYDDAIKKFKLFKEQYPDKKIIVIDGNKYNKLKKEYKHKVNWE